MTRDEFIQAVNDWGAQRIPFFFLIDFEFEKPVALPLDSIRENDLIYAMPSWPDPLFKTNRLLRLTAKHPISFSEYEERFNHVYRHLAYGDSYLTNLTIKTRIEIEGSLQELYEGTQARYKLRYKDEFLVFSPECFVRTSNGKIYSFPMKGTIDARVQNAYDTILNDGKELAEHVTIVDLIRNDLSRICEKVTVNRFRFVDRITTDQTDLLQVSSEIEGVLPQNYHERLGDIVALLLPAGSVSGAPKKKTMEIISQAEKESRGYYTGVFGVFDGTDFDSAVIIRYIEKENGVFYYRSGGGITTQSVAQREYQEAIDKIYLPLKGLALK